MRLSDSIEDFIKELFQQDSTDVELKRNELAEYFGCAPSQINYVLATRFTPDHGYVTESRRGGGGYIRIIRIVQDKQSRLNWLLQERIGTAITRTEAERLIQQLAAQGAVKEPEAALMRAAVSDQALAVPLPQNLKDTIRARTLKCMILSLATQSGDQPAAAPAEKGENRHDL